MTASTAELPARALTGTAGEPRGAEAQTAAAPAETQAPKKKSVFKRAISWVTTMLMVALLGLGVVLAVIPAMHGGTALTVLTGSMTPTIQPGDIAVVYAVDGFDDVEIGDIVTFMPKPDDPELVTHRAVGWTTSASGEKLLVTQGDANNSPDTPIMEKQLKAKVAYTVPWLGNVLVYSDFSKPILLIAAAVLLIGYSLYAVLSSVLRN